MLSEIKTSIMLSEIKTSIMLSEINALTMTRVRLRAVLEDAL